MLTINYQQNQWAVHNNIHHIWKKLHSYIVSMFLVWVSCQDSDCIKIIRFWDAMPWSLVKTYHYFGGTFWLSYYGTLKMETVYSFETSIPTHWTILCEDVGFHSTDRQERGRCLLDLPFIHEIGQCRMFCNLIAITDWTFSYGHFWTPLEGFLFMPLVALMFSWPQKIFPCRGGMYGPLIPPTTCYYTASQLPPPQLSEKKGFRSRIFCLLPW